MKFAQTAIKFFNALFEVEDGQDLVEYSLLLAFLALAAVGILSGIRTQTKGVWSTINSVLANVSTTAS